MAIINKCSLLKKKTIEKEKRILLKKTITKLE